MGIAGLVGGLEKGKAMKKLAKKQKRQQREIYEMGEASRQAISGQVQAQADIAQRQAMAAEQARFNVMASLGAPGTYDVPETRPGGPFSYSPLGLGGVGAAPSGVLTGGETVRKSGVITGKDVSVKDQPEFAGKRSFTEEGRVLDPDALVGQIKGTSSFRAVSRMVAESEQLLNKQGPLWDTLNNSITGGIYESSAASQRQMMEQLSREMAKGGTARNMGVRMAQAMRVQEQVNRERSSQLWQSKLSLESWIKQNAVQVQDMASAYVNNHAGIRDIYTSALTNLETYWSKVMPPVLIGAQAQSQGTLANAYMQADKMEAAAIDTKFNAIINGTNSIVSGVMNPLGGMMPGGGG